ncbi:MAG: restriction endonuclease subunit S [Myxococcota bacterium]
MPDHIPTRPLEELATITMGQSPESAMVNFNEQGLPFLQGCAEFGSRHPTARLHCSPPLRVAKAGSTLISVRAPVGTTNRADRDYCIGRGLGAVLARPDEADDVFLLSAIEHGVGYLHRRSQGSTFLAIGSDDLRSMPVPAPAIDAQRWIAELVSTVDEAIEQTEALIAKTQQIKAGLMNDLFTRGVTPDGQLRPAREEAPKLYKESPLGWIPKDWESSHLHKVAEVRTGIAKNEGRVFSRPIAVQYLRVANVQDGFLDLSEMKTVQIEAADLERYRVLAGDVLMNEGGDLDKLGRGAVWAGSSEPCVHQNHVFVVRCGTALLPVFLNAWTATPIARRYFMVAGKQTTNLASINKTQLGRLPVPIPPPQEQSEIVRGLDVVDARLQADSQVAAKLRLLKAGVMHDLLTGRVRVPVAKSQKVAANV